MDRGLLKDIVVSNELLDAERLRELEALSMSSGSSLIDTLCQGYIKEDVLLPHIAEYFGYAYQDLDQIDELDASLHQQLPDHLKEEALLPLKKVGDEVLLALTDPMNLEPVDELRSHTGWKLKTLVATGDKIRKTRERLLSGATPDAEAMPEIQSETADDRSLEDLANEAPTIKLVNLIIMQAISEGASDIHLDPYETNSVLRYRIDGVLREISSYPPAQYSPIISRLKIMANLNIAERRIPQDGRISIKIMERSYDLRVATIPLLHGEGVVMRILDKGSIMLDLEDLGFNPEPLEAFYRQIKKPHGIVLITGPTGSGKTTTLYAALSSIKSEKTKMITIEDPVEYYLEGITQIQVNSQVGMDFAAGMRSILRLDPDIVMVGEMRDVETADTAIRAALTGHGVFSTLHTNDAPSAITRLLDMGVQPFLISSSINAVLAQRLVRKICSLCEEDTDVSPELRALLEKHGLEVPDKVKHGTGCEDCGESGYQGRVGVHEILELSDELKVLVNENAPAETLRAKALECGMIPMVKDGLKKVLKGQTTLEEVLRVAED